MVTPETVHFVILLVATALFTLLLAKFIYKENEELYDQIKSLSEQFDRIQPQLDYLTSTKGNIK